MNDPTPTTIQAAALHQLTQHPDTPLLRPVRQRLERQGWLARVAGHGYPATAVTDAGREALARAKANPPPLDETTTKSLAAVAQAGPDGLRGRWPGSPMALSAARVFGLVCSDPPDLDAYLDGTFWLTEAGQQELHSPQPRTRKKPMTQTQARAIRAVALANDHEDTAVAAYRTCHERGWLQWADYADGHPTRRREVTTTGWKALLTHLQRRGELPLRLPVRALVAGHLVRLADPARADGQDPVQVAQTSRVTLSGHLLGYLILVPDARGPQPYPDRRPLSPNTQVEVFDHQLPTPRRTA